MKEKNKYHIWDIINLTVFYSVFICFLVSVILGIKDFIQGSLPWVPMLQRILLLALMCLPFLIKTIFKISFSKVVTIVYYIFMFISGFLGIALSFYGKIKWWDMLAHFLMGACVAVFSIYILNFTIYRKDRSKHNLFFTAVFMISFSLAIGAMWEIWEFLVDAMLGTNCQRYMVGSEMLVGQTALLDTMMDIIIDLAGAVVGVIFVFIAQKIDKNFLKSFYIKKLKRAETEVEYIEE